jgi:RimJ/RimL family protein N-acetyltransferase
MTAKIPAPVVLQGQHIRLEPLTAAHVPDLLAAGGGDEEVWRWLPVAPPRTEGEMRALAEWLLTPPGGRVILPFAVVEISTGRAVGWSSYLDWSAEDERVEIGWTWYGRAWWGTAVNAEAKLLLLTHAFDELGMGRVQWKTDCLNIRSQRAIAALGARRDGVHRRERRRPDGSWRDSVYFSMLGDEWTAARQRLVARVEGVGDGRGTARTPRGEGIGVSAVRPEDRALWTPLFEQYCAFYDVTADRAHIDRVWAWIQDPAVAAYCLVARDEDGRPIGLAHYRPWNWTTRGTVGCFLDDLFVDPAHRGAGVADALIREVRRIAAERGWAAVWWLTGDGNHRAQAVYERHAQQLGLRVYQVASDDGGGA